MHHHSSCHYCFDPSNPDVEIVRAAEVAGTDSDRTRGGPGSAVDRAAREVNVSAAVHLGPDLRPAMATTLLARTDGEDKGTDGWDRHSVREESDIVAGMAPMEVDHFRVVPGLPVVVAQAADAPGVEAVVLPDQRDRVAAADPVVVLVATVGHHLAVGMAEGSYRGSDPVHRAGRATGHERLNPVVEDDTVAGSPSDAEGYRGGVVEPIPADDHRTVGEAVQRMVVVVVAAVVTAVAADPVGVPVIDPDLEAEAAAVD